MQRRLYSQAELLEADRLWLAEKLGANDPYVRQLMWQVAHLRRKEAESCVHTPLLDTPENSDSGLTPSADVDD